MSRGLTNTQVETIEQVCEWIPVRDMAEIFGVSNTTIYSVLKERGLNSYTAAQKMRRHRAVREVMEIEKAYRENILQTI